MFGGESGTLPSLTFCGRRWFNRNEGVRAAADAGGRRRPGKGGKGWLRRYIFGWSVGGSDGVGDDCAVHIGVILLLLKLVSVQGHKIGLCCVHALKACCAPPPEGPVSSKKRAKRPHLFFAYSERWGTTKSPLVSRVKNVLRAACCGNRDF